MSEGEAPPDTTYGFVGIGVMGYGMAMNLRTKIPSSSRFIVCELNEARRQQFLDEAKSKSLPPVEVVPSPRDVAEQAEVMVTMLPKGSHVREVFENPQTGFLSMSKPDKPRFFLECSSIDTKTSVDVSQTVASSGVGQMIDAPVSGGPAWSDAGTLTFMVGGPDELVQKAIPILSLMGRKENIFRCGGPGAGLATKQLNNYLGYVGYLGLCEVMSTGLAYGLDPKILSNVLNNSSGQNFNTLNHNPVKGVNPKASSATDFKPGFAVELAAGVIHDAVGLMDEVGVKTVLAKTVDGLYQRALTNPKTKGMESRSVWKMFVEDDGKDLDGLGQSS